MQTSFLSVTKRTVVEGITVLKSRYKLIIVCCLITMITSFLYCKTKTLQYQTTAKIAIFPKRRSFNLTKEVQFSPKYIEHFYFTQYIIMHSNRIFQDVISRLDLRKRLSPYPNYELPDDIAINWVRRSVKIIFSEEANVVEIVVTHRDRVLATEIANTFVESYINQQLVSKKTKINETLKDLEIKLEDARKRLLTSEDAVEKIKRDQNLSFVQGFNIDKKKLEEFNKSYLSTRIDRITKELRLKKVKELSDEAKTNLVALETEYKNLINLRNLLGEQEIKLASLESDYGSRHPDVIETKTKVRELQEEVKTEVKGILSGLEIEYNVIKKRENDLLDILDKAKKEIFDLESTELKYVQAEREMQINQEMYIMLKKEYIKQLSLYELPERTVEIISNASVPLEDQFVYPNYLKSMGASTFSSFFMTIIFVLLFNYVEQNVYKKARATAFSVMTVIPTGVELINSASHDSSKYESFRILATKLTLLAQKQSLKTLFITSGGAGEGKTTVATNLAFVLGEMGKKVLLVDYNLRKPDIPDFVQVEIPEVGLWNINEHKKNYMELIVPIIFPNVDLLPAGKTPQDLDITLTKNTVKSLIDMMQKKYDFVLFDGPPLIGFGDSVLLAKLVNAVLLVVGYKMFPDYSSEIVEEYLKGGRIPLIGTILNNVHPEDETYKYYYQTLKA